MELRAAHDTDVSEDLIPPLAPIVAALHDRFLHSHCSSCFLPLPKIPPPSQNTPPIPSCSLCSSIRYCSSRCSSPDLPIHTSSSECLLLQSHSSTCLPSADVRAALRLLHSLRTLPSLPGRFGGLFAGLLREVLGESGSETGTRIRQGAELMRRTRSGNRSDDDDDDDEETAAMWAVMANAVEVQVGEGAPLGVAVYGPGFSWFNHSCLPNACYRFERHGSSGSGGFRVVPAGIEEPPDTWKMWVPGETKLNEGLCIYGPRIIVRSIKPIKKGEEVFITYTDLLQPKATRNLDLWLKYRFLCCCERCLASPEMYIDQLLNCDARNMDSDHDFSRDADCNELADFLDQTISEYMSDGIPEVCCEKIESMLSKTFKYCQFQEEPYTFWLHPLHNLSLNAYIALASAYRALGSNMIATYSGEDGLPKAIKMLRGAAAYSLLLAGATHHLFLSESSLIQSTAVFWINAGESVMDLVRSSCGPDFGLISRNYQFMPVKDPFVSTDNCKTTSTRFHECILSHLTKYWTYLADVFSYLENIESPIDFSWLGTKITKILTRTDVGEHFEYRCRAKTSFGEDMKSLFQLAVYCLTYGRFLANICYGPQCYLSDKVGNVLSINPPSIG